MSPKHTESEVPGGDERRGRPRPDPRIFLVQDDQDLRESMLRILRRLNFQVRACPDAESAIPCLDDGPFDLLITELWLPGMTGLELVRQARLLQSDLPSLILTASPHQDLPKNLESLGIRGVLAKPVLRADLLRAIIEAIDPIAVL